MKKSNIFLSKLKRGAPTVLTMLTVAGVITTGILSARAANKTRNESDISNQSSLNNFKSGWKNYIPAIAVGGVTIACSIRSDVLNKRHRVALLSAYAIANRSYTDYVNKTKELYGEETHRKIMESIAAEKAEEVYISSPNICGATSLAFDDRDAEEKRLFYDSYLNRYFESTLSQVLEAEYHLNRNYVMGMGVCVNDFYAFLGIDTIEGGDKIGWFLDDEIYWIDFNHYKTTLDDGLEVYVIEFIFPPRLATDDDY